MAQDAVGALIMREKTAVIAASAIVLLASVLGSIAWYITRFDATDVTLSLAVEPFIDAVKQGNAEAAVVRLAQETRSVISVEDIQKSAGRLKNLADTFETKENGDWKIVDIRQTSL